MAGTSKRSVGLILLALAHVGSGCDMLSPYGGGPPSGDYRPVPDLPLDTGTSAESVATDLAAPDAAPPAADTTIDVARIPDAPTTPDAPTPDAPTPDAPTPDAPTPDALAPDVTPPPPPCNVANALADHVVDAKMVFCKATAPGTLDYNQCEAEQQLCNTAAGWTLCPASAFGARFTAAAAPVTYPAWLAGCVRSGAVPHAPTDGTCGACLPLEGTMANVAWSCDGSQIVSKGKAIYYGVATDPACRRLGLNQAALMAFWQVEATANPFPAAVCCQP